jgi:hypothetical protein
MLDTFRAKSYSRPIVPKTKRDITMRMVHRHVVRLNQANHNWVELQAKAAGLSSSQQYIRQLIERERTGTSSALVSLEDRLGALIEKQSSELSSTQLTAFLTFAATMALAQTLFQTILPPTREARQVLDANLKARMDKFIQTVGIDMKGKWATTLQSLVEEAQNE